MIYKSIRPLINSNASLDMGRHPEHPATTDECPWLVVATITRSWGGITSCCFGPYTEVEATKCYDVLRPLYVAIDEANTKADETIKSLYAAHVKEKSREEEVP